MNEARHDELVDQLKANQERWEANKTAWEKETFDDPFAYKRKAVLWDEHYSILEEEKALIGELRDYYNITQRPYFSYQGYMEAVETGAWERKECVA